MAASGWHPAHFTQKTCSFQVKTGLLHPLILKQMRQPHVYPAKKSISQLIASKEGLANIRGTPAVRYGKSMKNEVKP